MNRVTLFILIVCVGIARPVYCCESDSATQLLDQKLQKYLLPFYRTQFLELLESHSKWNRVHSKTLFNEIESYFESLYSLKLSWFFQLVTAALEQKDFPHSFKRIQSDLPAIAAHVKFLETKKATLKIISDHLESLKFNPKLQSFLKSTQSRIQQSGLSSSSFASDLSSAWEEHVFRHSLLEFDSGGNGFVAGRIGGHAVIISNAHVIKNNNTPTVYKVVNGSRTSLGPAKTVIEGKILNYLDEINPDIALLTHTHSELEPIHLVPKLEGELAGYVSLLHRTVRLPGHILTLKRHIDQKWVYSNGLMILLGSTDGIHGDSGSPILVKRDDTFSSIGVIAAEGTRGWTFTPDIIKGMQRALNNKSPKPGYLFSVLTNDSLQKSTIRKFLKSL